MRRLSLERRARRIALTLLAASMTVAAGAGIATWALGETNDFYMNPVDRYGSPAYARPQPLTDTFWRAQDGSAAAPRNQAGATSTATSAQPAYRSASGS